MNDCTLCSCKICTVVDDHKAAVCRRLSALEAAVKGSAVQGEVVAAGQAVVTKWRRYAWPSDVMRAEIDRLARAVGLPTIGAETAITKEDGNG